VLKLDDMAAVIIEAVNTATAPLRERLAVLEANFALKGGSAPGPPGPAGERGTGFTSGYGIPQSEGKSGDVYLDLKTGEVYEWR
jgi:hypothetical protein